LILRLLFPLLLILAIDWYFFQSLKTITSESSINTRSWTTKIYWGISILSILVAIVLLIAYQNQWINRTMFAYVMCVVFILFASKLTGSLFLVIDDIIRLFRWIFSFLSNPSVEENLNENTISRAKFLSYAGITLAALPFTSMIYGMVKTAFDFKVRKSFVQIPGLPNAFDGLRIIQISDIHSGSFLNGSAFKNAVELIMEQKPDIIFFTGDLVNDKTDEAHPFVDIWKNLSAPYGIFSIVGNHDYGDYIQWPSDEAKAENFENLKKLHKKMGWDLLLNENRIIEKEGEQLAILGVENWGATLRFPRKGDINKAKQGVEHIPNKLLLSHDPSHWDAEVVDKHPDIKVTFSGHTHGFQFGIEIPGFKWSPSQYVYDQWAGLYSKGAQHIYVNRGLGFLGYLGRVGIKPEITLMELKS
jgi:predicted MPP superfamily phosphohydrolase